MFLSVFMKVPCSKIWWPQYRHKENLTGRGSMHKPKETKTYSPFSTFFCKIIKRWFVCTLYLYLPLDSIEPIEHKTSKKIYTWMERSQPSVEIVKFVKQKKTTVSKPIHDCYRPILVKSGQTLAQIDRFAYGNRDSWILSQPMQVAGCALCWWWQPTLCQHNLETSARERRRLLLVVNGSPII